MASDDGRLRVVFNGEIYNFRALRRELEDEGCHFRSESDTEVILHGWRAWGIDLLDRISTLRAEWAPGEFCEVSGREVAGVEGDLPRPDPV